MSYLRFQFCFIIMIMMGCGKDSLEEVQRTSGETFTTLKYLATTNLSAPRYLPEAAVVGSKIYFSPGANETFEGLDIVDVYDTLNRTWNVLKLPKKMIRPYITSYGSKLILSGGYSGNKAYHNLEVYDTLTKKWTSYLYQYAHLTGAQTTLGKLLFLAGGQDFITAFEQDMVEVFDMESLSFLPAMKLSIPRMYAHAYAFKNKAFFLWGSQAILGGKQYSRLDAFDVVTKKWDTADVVRPNSQSVWGYNKYGIIDNSTIAFTTCSYNIPSNSDSIYFYNTDKHTWSAIKNLAPNVTEAILVAGNLMILAGGSKELFNDISYESINVYDLTKKTWQSIRLTHPRNSIELFRFGNKIYIAGGSDNYKLSNVVEIFELVK